AVNPGNSGGPLVDEWGQLAGVVTLKANLENVGFAVPVETVRTVFESPQRAAFRARPPRHPARPSAVAHIQSAFVGYHVRASGLSWKPVVRAGMAVSRRFGATPPRDGSGP